MSMLFNDREAVLSGELRSSILQRAVRGVVHSLRRSTAERRRPRAAKAIHYRVDELEKRTMFATQLSLLPESPTGARLYGDTFVDRLDDIGEVDEFTVQLESGQKLSARVLPRGNSVLKPIITILDSNDDIVIAQTASVGGQAAILDRFQLPAGTYTIQVSGADSTSGRYELKALLNSGFESEPLGAALNDTPATAGNLNNGPILLQGSGRINSIAGQTDGVGKSDQYRVDLAAGESLNAFLSTNNSGFGQFNFETMYQVSPNLYAIATGDFNGDGLADIVTGGEGTSGRAGLNVLLSREEGGYDTVEWGADFTIHDLAVGDFNNDGNLDVATLGRWFGQGDYYQPNQYQDTRLTYYYGDGAGNRDHTHDQLVSPAYTIASGDINNDGRDDLAIGHFPYLENGEQEGSFSLILSNESGGMDSPREFLTQRRVYDIQIADFDGDGYGDILTGEGTDNSSNESGAVGQYFIDPESFDSISKLNYHYEGISEAIVRVAAGVSANGVMRIAGLHLGGDYGMASVWVLNEDGDPTLGFGQYAQGERFGLRAGIAFADINRDGIIDLLTSEGDPNSANDNQVNLNLGSDDGFFNNGGSGYSMDNPVATFALGDLNDDGELDLVSLSAHSFDSESYSQLGIRTGKGEVRLELRNAAGQKLVGSSGGGFDIELAIREFIATEAGSYYVHVSGDYGQDYQLSVSAGAVFGMDPDEWEDRYQSLTSARQAAQRIDYQSDYEKYKLSLNAGDPITAIVEARQRWANDSLNNLKPYIRLYDPNGNLVASFNNPSSLSTATLNYTAVVAGQFTLEVAGDGNTYGDYDVTVTGNTAALPPLTLRSNPHPDYSPLWPKANEVIDFRPNLFMQFSSPILATSVQGTDVLINGQPAEGVYDVGGDYINFNSSAAFPVDGVYTITVPAGAFVSTSGVPNEAINYQITVDQNGPRVTSSSIAPNAVLQPGGLAWKVKFSEGLRTFFVFGSQGFSLLDSSDIQMSNLSNGQLVPVSQIVYNDYDANFDPRELDLIFNNLGEGLYEARLRSAQDGFSSIYAGAPNGFRGNELDGDNDGNRGGDYVQQFIVDAVGITPLTQFTASSPVGSLVHELSTTRAFHATGDVDSFSINLDSNQQISVTLVPSNGSGATIKLDLIDPNGNTLGTTTGENGQTLLLQSIAGTTGGTYRIDASSLNGIAGYTLRVIVGAAVEEESAGAASNNSRETAQSLALRQLATGFTGVRAGLVGAVEAGTEDFYKIDLVAGQAASFALSGINGSVVNFRLEDASGNLITTGGSGQYNADRTAIDFLAPAAGTYFVVVTGTGGYSLLATRAASYEHESKTPLANPQDLSVTKQVLGHLKGGPVGGEEIKVLEIAEPFSSGGDLNRLINQLNNDTYANFTATRTNHEGADTIAELRGYDAVLLTQSTTAWFTPGLATALRQYVELGGTLVVIGAAMSFMATSGMTNLRPVLPFDVTKGVTSVNGLVTPVGTHPITAGIAPGNLFATHYTPNTAGILSGTTVVATSSNGAPTVLVRENIGFGGRVVTLAPEYGSAFSNDATLRTGIGDQLLEQTLMWSTGSGDQSDTYSISVNSGDTLTLTTSLPQGDTALPTNDLDPIIDLYSPTGVLLATNDDGPDGINARVLYTVPAGQAGVYRVVVRAAGLRGGAYTLQATGATGSALVVGPTVVSTTPKHGNVAATPTSTIDIDLSENILASSIQTSDLTVVGGSVTGVQLIDGDTVRFTISVPDVDTTYSYTLADGAFRDLQGQLSSAYTGNFVVDKRGAYIISATPSSQASSPFTTWTFTFNEPIQIPTNYNYNQIFDITAPGGTLESWRFNNPVVSGNTMTLTFQPQTVAGTYTVTIKPGIIRDLVGNLMDQDQDGINGEPVQDQFSRSITLASPNLVVDSVQLLDTPVFGSPVTVQWTVRNNGSDPAASGWSDRVYLSTDNVVDDSDLILLTLGTPTLPLAAGASYTRTQTINLPLNVNVTPGSYRFIVRTDRANTQAESSETDNTNFTAPTTVALPPLPDLAVSNVEVIAPANPASGQPATLRWTLTNTGTATISGVIRDQFLLSGDAVVGSDVDLGGADYAVNLAPGQSVVRTQAVNLPVNQFGQKYFLVRTDANNVVFEHVQEANNVGASAAVDISLSPVPDLVVTNITAPTTAQSGTTQTITWVLANQGSGSFTGTINENIFLSDDAVIGSDQLFKSVSFTGTIAAGQVITRSETITLPINYSGPKRVVIQTDASNSVFENTGETNNVSIDDTEMNVTLPPLPDLLVTSITAPGTTASGRAIPVSWTIRNDGPVAFTGSFEQLVALSSDAVAGNDQNFASFTFTGTILPGQTITQSHTIALPSIFSGTYRVVVTADSGNGVFENTNEGNNTLVDDVDLVVTQAAYPNLTVDSITVPPSGQSEEQVDISWVVGNHGDGATSAPEWYDNVYLSSSPVFDSTAVQVARVRNASYLNPNEFYEQTQTITLPRGLQGDYFVYVLTDSGNQVFEYSPSANAEADNRAISSAISITLAPPPDLRVSSVVAPLVAFSGEVTTVSWLVANNGLGVTKPGQTSWIDSVYLSTDTTFSAEDVRLGDFTHTGALAPGATYAAQGNVRLPVGISGDFYFIVRTDVGDTVYEDAFEANNATSETTPTEVLLAAPPDLAVTSVTAPTLGTAGRSITVDFTVVNEGSSATPNSYWSDRLYLSPTPTLEAETAILIGNRGHSGALAAGGTYSDQFNAAIPLNLEGQYYVFVASDAAGEVFELNNTNNNKHALATIGISQRFADLHIGSFSPPATAEAGGFTPMSWTINNTGTGDTIVGQWTDRVVLSSDNVLGNGDDVSLADGTHNGLVAAGGSYTANASVAIPAYIPAGTYNLFLTTDLFQQVYETNEANNTTALSPIPITITRQTADLQVTGVSIPATGGGGQTIPVSFTVGNLGTATTNATSWVDEVYLSADTTIGSTDLLVGQIQRTNVLAAGGSYTVNTTITLPDVTGTFYIIARTDRGNQVVEAGLDGNNDRASTGIAIGQQFLPDLKVSVVGAPAEANAGQSAAVSWTVLNDGASISSNLWYDTVYLSRDTTLDRTDTALGSFQRNGSLGAGATYSDTQTVALPPGLSGEFYFIVSTDNSNRIYERNNENNNTGFNPAGTTLRLLPPADLVAGLITLPAGTYAPGSDVSITYEVTNGSSEPAIGNWADSLYISADPTWDVNDKLFGRVDHVGDVAAGATYSHTVTAPLPGVVSGDYYVIVRSDIRNQITESNENNNLSASLSNVVIDVPQLTLGVPASDTIAQGKSVYYRVTVGDGETLLVDLDAAAANGSTQLYVKRNGVPSRADFDFGYTAALSADQKIVIPKTEAGTYYILAYGDSLAAPTSYSIEARALQFEVIDTDYGVGGNGGKLTLQINGAKFDRSITPTLVSPGGGERAAAQVFYTSSTRLYATFDLTGLAPNAYDVKLTKSGGASFTVPDALQVVPAQPAVAKPVIFGPDMTGRGALFQFTVSWGNDGINDVPAPYLVVTADRPIGQNPDFIDAPSYTFLGVGQDDGPAGLLRPGQTAQREFYSINGASGTTMHVIADRLDDGRRGELFDWSSQVSFVKPTEFSSQEFAPVLERLIQNVGTTWGQVVDAAALGASIIPPLLGFSRFLGGGLRAAMWKAAAEVTTSIAGRVFAADIEVPIGNRNVIARNTATDERFTAISMLDGSFYLTRLPAGQYELTVDGAKPTTSPMLVNVANGQHVTGPVLDIERGSSVDGTVRKGSGSGPAVANATVRAVNEETGDSVEVQADSQGRYQIAGLVTGTYTIVASAPALARAFVQHVEIGDDESVTRNFVVVGESRLQATVVSPVGPNTALSATVTFSPIGNTEIGAFTGVFVGNRLEVSQLPAGTYELQINREGYVTHEQIVTVGAEQTLDLGTINLSLGGMVSGVVESFDPSQSPARMLVGAFPVGGGGEVAVVARVQADGSYALRGIPAGSYVIKMLNGSDLSTTVPVTVANGTVISDAVLRLYPGGKITGTVTNPITGQPVARLRVVLRGGLTKDGYVETDANGQYVFESLPIGNYVVAVGGAAQPVSVSDLNGTTTANLSVPVSARISGVVRDYQGNPLTGVVRLERDNQVVTSTLSENGGGYEFLIAEPGLYSIVVEGGDASFARYSNVNVVAGGDLSLDFSAGQTSVNVSVTDGAGSVDGMRVNLVQETPNGVVLVASDDLDATGVTSFGRLVAGNYRVIVSGPNGRGGHQAISVGASGSSNVAVTVGQQGTVSGVVTGIGGVPLAGAGIALIPLDSSSTPAGMAISKADGTYILKGVPAGVYNLSIYSSGYAASHLTNVTVNAGGTITFSPALAADASQITGRIVASAGQPAAIGEITVMNAAGTLVLGYGSANADGTFTIRGVSGNDLVLHIGTLGGGFRSFTGINAAAGSVTSFGDLLVPPLAFVANDAVELAATILSGRSGVSLNAGGGTSGGVTQGNGSFAGLNSPDWLADAFFKSPDHVTKDVLPDLDKCKNCSNTYQNALNQIILQDAQYDVARSYQKLQERYDGWTYTALAFETAQNLGVFATIVLAVDAIAAASAAVVVADGAVTSGAIGLGAIRGSYGLAYTLTQVGSGIWSLKDLMEIEGKKQEPGGKSTLSFIQKFGNLVTGMIQLLGTVVDELSPTSEHANIFMMKKFGARLNLLSLVLNLNNILKTMAYTETRAFATEASKAEDQFKLAYASYLKQVEKAKHAVDLHSDCLALAPQDCDPTQDFPFQTMDTVRPVHVINPTDPNDILGPVGFGPQKFVPASVPLDYRIRYENDPNATAPAQVVTITQTLDSDLDVRTFRLGDFGFSGEFFDVPADSSFYQTRLDLRETHGIYLDVVAGVDIVNRQAFWRFISIDPATGDVPTNPLLGFLPTNLTSPQGEGFVQYTIRPNAGATSGDVIDAVATIVFDKEAPIDTPAIFNTLDALLPGSAVGALPAASASDFVVFWNGDDDVNGSAIATFDIYVSDNGGAYQLWLDNTDLRQAIYTGQAGHSYAFYSVAVDNAGNVEAVPLAPDATTTVTSTNNPPTVDLGDPAGVVDEGFVFTRNGVASDIDAGDILTAEVDYADGNGFVPLTLNPDGTFQLSVIYPDNGARTITVRVTDVALVTTEKTIAVTVNNVNPLVTPIVDQTIGWDGTGGTFTLDGVFADPSLTDTFTGEVNFGAGFVPLTLNADKTYALNHRFTTPGLYAVTVRITDDDGGVGTHTFNVRLLPPKPAATALQVNDGNAQRSMVKTLTVTFDQAITALPSSALTLTLRTPTGPQTVAATLTAAAADGTGKVWTISLTGTGLEGGSLADGVYDLAINGALVTDSFGQPMAASASFSFHRLFGDRDGDRDTDTQDITYLRQVQGKPAFYNWIYDVESNGSIDNSDYVAARLRLGKQLFA